MPTLNWIGKEADVKHHKEMPFRLLESAPKLSCGPADKAISMPDFMFRLVLMFVLLSGCAYAGSTGTLQMADRLGAQAVSFDCNKASSKIEHMICSSKALSKLEDNLAIVYKKLLNNTTDDIKKQFLVSEQRNWIAYVRDACRDDDCLSEVYRIRTQYFQMVNSGWGNANSSHTFELVTAPDQVSAIIGNFQNSLTRLGVNIHLGHCPIVLSAPYYRAQVNGAVCMYGNKNQHALMMCDDSMVGYFAIQFGFGESVENVKEFATSNCYKGG